MAQRCLRSLVANARFKFSINLTSQVGWKCFRMSSLLTAFLIRFLRRCFWCVAYQQSKVSFFWWCSLGRSRSWISNQCSSMLLHLIDARSYHLQDREQVWSERSLLSLCVFHLSFYPKLLSYNGLKSYFCIFMPTLEFRTVSSTKHNKNLRTLWLFDRWCWKNPKTIKSYNYGAVIRFELGGRARE